jgi:hypothetical protein
LPYFIKPFPSYIITSERPLQIGINSYYKIFRY